MYAYSGKNRTTITYVKHKRAKPPVKTNHMLAKLKMISVYFSNTFSKTECSHI